MYNWKGWQYIFWACSQSVLIIIIGDYFAKWTEAFPISNQEAKMVVDVLVCKLILSHIVKCLVSSIPIRSTILKLTYCRRCAIVLASRRPECHHKGHDQMEWWKGINRMLNNQLAMYLPDHQQEIWDGQYPVQRKIKDFIEWKYMYNKINTDVSDQLTTPSRGHQQRKFKWKQWRIFQQRVWKFVTEEWAD